MHTVFSGLQGSFGEGEMCFIWCSDDNQLNLSIREYILNSFVYFYWHSKSIMYSSTWGLRVTFKDRMESEQFGKGKDERDMKSEPR